MTQFNKLLLVTLISMTPVFNNVISMEGSEPVIEHGEGEEPEEGQRTPEVPPTVPPIGPEAPVTAPTEPVSEAPGGEEAPGTTIPELPITTPVEGQPVTVTPVTTPINVQEISRTPTQLSAVSVDQLLNEAAANLQELDKIIAALPKTDTATTSALGTFIKNIYSAITRASGTIFQPLVTLYQTVAKYVDSSAASSQLSAIIPSTKVDPATKLATGIAIISAHPELVNYKDSTGATLLAVSVRANNEDAVKTLMGMGADPTIKDKAGNSPRSIALNSNRWDIINLMAPKTS